MVEVIRVGFVCYVKVGFNLIRVFVFWLDLNDHFEGVGE